MRFALGSFLPASLFVPASLLLPGVVLAERPSVVVRAQAEIAAPVVRLGDVAQLRGLETAERERWAAVELGSAPPAGQARNIAGRTIRQRIASSGLGAGVSLRVPKKISVRRPATTVTGAALAARIRTAVQSEIGALAPDETIEFPVPPAMEIPAGAEVTLRLESGPGGGLAAKLRVIDAGRTIRTRRVALVVDRQVDVPVLVSPLPRGACVAAGDVEHRRVSNRSLPSGVVMQAGELEGSCARRSLRAGMPIVASALEQPVLIERRARIAMIARRGPMTVTAMGESLSKGRRGEVIRVRNLNSGAIVTGRVQGPGRVVMEF